MNKKQTQSTLPPMVPYGGQVQQELSLPPMTPFGDTPPMDQPQYGQVDGYGGSVLQQITGSVTPQAVKNFGVPGASTARAVISTVSPVLDILSRPNYAIARFFDSDADVSKSLMQNFQDAYSELVDPKMRLSFSDVIAKHNPRFAQESPTSTAVLGFLADIAFDPTTYLGAGLAKTGLRVGGVTLAKDGLQALEAGSKIAGKSRYVSTTAADIMEILDVETRHAAKTGQVGFSPAGTSILKDAGYFDELDNRATEIAKQFGNNIPRVQAEELAGREIYQDLRNAKYRGIIDPLSTNEVRERVEERISRIAAINPDFKLFEKEGFRVKIGVPFGKQYDIPGSAKVFDALGINKLAETISSLGGKIPGTKTVNRIFNKEAEFDTLPKEFVDNLRELENTFDNLTPSVVRDAQQMGSKIPEARRELIQDTMYNIDDATREFEDKIGRTVTVQEAAQIKMDHINNAKLTPEEFALTSSLYTGYAKAAELEMRANLLHTAMANYSHREYAVLKDATRTTNVMKPNSNNLNTFLGSSQARDYRTIAEARAAGNVPEMDALVVYAQRMLKHGEKMAVAHFNDTVRTVFDLGGEYGAQLSTKEFNKLPQVVQNSIRSLGDSVYPSSMNNEVKNVLKVLDTAMSWWKRGAYAIKPASGIKQGISNTIQAAMISGMKVGKSFDPRAVADAALLLFDRGKPTKALPKFVDQLITGKFGNDAVLASRMSLSRITGDERLFDYAKDFSITNSFGIPYHGEDLVKSMREGGVIKGFDASGETLKLKINSALKYNPDSIGMVAGQLAKPWAWPAFAEDYGRAMVYLNEVRMGKSHIEAVKQVNRGLFDYSRGLSYVEKTIFKRLILFYTYPRFAIPMVLKNVVTQPGNAVTADKVVKLLGKMFSGDSMTPAEQESLPGYLLEQPRVYQGFDKDGKVGFNVLNNLTPFDSINLFVHDEKGNIDYRRSVEKSVLAAMTPYLKVPLETILPNGKGGRGYQFFTGAPIAQAGKMGNIENNIGATIPDFVKKAIGWENRVNSKGQTSVYINPYLAYYTMGAIPGLKTYINVYDEGKTPLEKSMDLLMGISSQKIDLKEQYQINLLKDKKELMQLKTGIRSAKRKGSENEYETSRREYVEFVNSIQRKQSIPGPIRGQGLNSPDSAPTNPTTQPETIFK